MTDTSKLTLSDGEMQLVCNTDWILTKHKIIDKVYGLLGNLATAMQHKITAADGILPPAVLAAPPKIAKGENYRQLPYVILDYPRCFEKENIFAIRTMFWWGNFFSCTLHVSGSYKTMFEHAILENIQLLQQNDFYICTGSDEWQHHFEAGNYRPVNDYDAVAFKTILQQQHFIKVAAKFPLQQWSAMEVMLEKSFLDIIQILKN
ncbi:hypothetical protein [Ferruginibacter sp.]